MSRRLATGPLMSSEVSRVVGCCRGPRRGGPIIASASWVLIRWGLDEESLEPITFAALRYGLAALVLVGWVLTRKPLRQNVAELNRSSVAQIVVLGLVFYALTQGALFVAIDNQPAATTSLVLSWTPLLVAVLGGWSIAEAASKRQLTGTLLVATGAWFYFAGDLGATTAGMAAALVGLGANVGSALLGRHVNRQANLAPVVVTALGMAVGAAFLVAAGVAVEGAAMGLTPRMAHHRLAGHCQHRLGVHSLESLTPPALCFGVSSHQQHDADPDRRPGVDLPQRAPWVRRSSRHRPGVCGSAPDPNHTRRSQAKPIPPLAMSTTQATTDHPLCAISPKTFARPDRHVLSGCQVCVDRSSCRRESWW